MHFYGRWIQQIIIIISTLAFITPWAAIYRVAQKVSHYQQPFNRIKNRQ